MLRVNKEGKIKTTKQESWVSARLEQKCGPQAHGLQPSVSTSGEAFLKSRVES